MNDIGKRIKNRRIELGYSQEELAKKLGYTSRSTINKIENGTNDITQSKVKDFAIALDTTVQYLMGWTEKPDLTNSNGKTEQKVPNQLVDLYFSLNENGQDQLIKYAQFLTTDPDFKKDTALTADQAM